MRTKVSKNATINMAKVGNDPNSRCKCTTNQEVFSQHQTELYDDMKTKTH